MRDLFTEQNTIPTFVVGFLVFAYSIDPISVFMFSALIALILAVNTRED